MSEAKRLADQFFADPPLRPDGALRERPRGVVWTAAGVGLLVIWLAAVSIASGDSVASIIGPLCAAGCGWAAYAMYQGRAVGWTSLAVAAIFSGLSLVQLAYDAVATGDSSATVVSSAIALLAATACGLMLPTTRAWCGCLREKRPPVRRRGRPVAALTYATVGVFAGTLICATLFGLFVTSQRLPPSFILVLIGPLLLYGGVGLFRGRHRGWAVYAGAIGLVVITALQLLVRAVKTGGTGVTEFGVLLGISSAALAGLYLPRVRSWCGVHWVSVRATAAIWSMIVFGVVAFG